MKARGLTKETIYDLGVKDRGFDVFNVGDAIIVGLRIKEGDKERIQNFEGDVIAVKRRGIATTFTVRRIAADGVSVERIFPLYSPVLESIKFVRRGKVRRAKLYYMRTRIGKAARVQEKVMTREQKERRKSTVQSLSL